MSEQQHDEVQQNQSGFVDETALAEPAPPTEKTANKARKQSKKEEMVANLSSVFGHGFGKMAVIAVVLFLIVAAALISRQFFGGPKGPNVTPSNVDVPSAPPPAVTVDAIDAKEAARRSQQANLEASAAQASGKSYVPEFNPVVNQGQQPGQPQAGQGGMMPPLPNGGANGTQAQQSGQPVPITIATGQQPGNTAADQQQLAELDRRRAKRDKDVEELHTTVLTRVKQLLGEDNTNNTATPRGSYSVSSYVPAQKTQAAQGQTTNAQAPATTSQTAQPASTTNNQKMAFKAGSMAFAEIDSEVNTDDGGDVLATIRGGKYDGARLIGKIENAPRNIRLRFSTLAPQDDRQSLKIDAIAIREQDAKQGVADSIDNHTLERYGALFASSILSGLGKAAQQPQGNVIILPNGQTITQNSEMTNKRLAMFAAGDVGINASGEVKKLVDQPPTYKVAARRGIGIVFLSDVLEK